jgi:tetratricopeptide (TPR) repeat protein
MLHCFARKCGALLVLAILIGLSSCQTTAGPSQESSAQMPEYEQAFRKQIESALDWARANRFSEAEVILIEVIEELEAETRPISWRTRVSATSSLGYVYMDMGQPLRARTWLDKAATIYHQANEPVPTQATILFENLGRVRGMTGDPEGAIKAFDQAIEEDLKAPVPSDEFATRMHLLRAYAYEELEEYENSLEAFELALEIQDRIHANSSKPGGLGLMYLDYAHKLRFFRRFVDSLQAAVRAAELLEKEGQNIARLADAYYLQAINLMQAGIDEGQAQAYLRAINLYTRTEFPNFEFLGVAYYNMGHYLMDRHDFQQAQFYFQKALETYGYTLRVLNQQEREAPGSVEPVVMNSFTQRHADAQNQVREVTRLLQSPPPLTTPQINDEAVRSQSTLPISRFILDVIYPTLEDNNQNVRLVNQELVLAFEPDQIFTLTNLTTGSTFRGRRGFEITTDLTSGTLYLLQVDPAKMSREDFNQNRGYLRSADTVLQIVENDGTQVTFEFLRPAGLIGQRLMMELEKR